jgi:hypothetical protein
MTARSSGLICLYIFDMQHSPLDLLHLQGEFKVSLYVI